MEFQRQLLAVRTTQRVAFLPAMVGVGSGLAYARQPHEQTYDLIHVASGWFLCQGPYSQQEAQTWVERLAPLTDWIQDEQAIRELEVSFILHVAHIRDEIAYEHARTIFDALPACSEFVPIPVDLCSCCSRRNGYWLFNDGALCYPCMSSMSIMNSDNAEVFEPILQELHKNGGYSGQRTKERG